MLVSLPRVPSVVSRECVCDCLWRSPPSSFPSSVGGIRLRPRRPQGGQARHLSVLWNTSQLIAHPCPPPPTHPEHRLVPVLYIEIASFEVSCLSRECTVREVCEHHWLPPPLLGVGGAASLTWVSMFFHMDLVGPEAAPDPECRAVRSRFSLARSLQRKAVGWVGWLGWVGGVGGRGGAGEGHHNNSLDREQPATKQSMCRRGSYCCHMGSHTYAPTCTFDAQSVHMDTHNYNSGR